jgi:L-ascorbate metabolism protein UlaG (beta-lactamase superfamily)
MLLTGLMSCNCQNNTDAEKKSNMKDSVKSIAEKIQLFGQACAKVEYNGKIVYFDPFNLKSADTTDIVFITHGHFDHLSPENLRRIVQKNTTIIAPADLHKTLSDSGFTNLRTAEIGKPGEISGLKYSVVPAYNIIKSDKHPKSNNWVGYVVDFGGVKVYHAGDTERIPEMKNMSCDIVLLPLGQTYTMNSVEEAVATVTDVKASYAIPMHYGMYEGKAEDAEKFKELLKDKAEVLIKDL